MELVTFRKSLAQCLLIVISLIFLSLPFLSEAQTSLSNIEDVENTSVSKVLIDTPYVTEDLEGGIVGDFVVGPGKVEISLLPGESKTTELIVTNRMGETKIFNLEVEDASGTDDPNKSIVLLGDDRGPYSLKDYVSVKSTKFELGHNQRARIPVTISLPVDAEPGGHYGSVLVSTVSRNAEFDPNGGTEPSSAILSRVGTLFFVTTPGSADVSGLLESFQTIPDTPFFLGGPINFGIVYKNTGSVHLNPYGEIRITNMLNQEVGFLEIDPWFTLPKSLRTREVRWDRELLIGRYVATVYINRGYNNIVDEKQIIFWVIPWKLIISITVGLFVFFLGLRFVVSRFEFKRKHK